MPSPVASAPRRGKIDGPMDPIRPSATLPVWACRHGPAPETDPEIEDPLMPPVSDSPARPAIRLSRRQALSLATSAGLMLPLGLTAGASAAEEAQAPGDTPGAPFSFDILTEDMRKAPQSDYAPPSRPEGYPKAATYDDYRLIRFREENARWADEDGAERFHLHAFHLGWLYEEPVELFEVEDGTARPMVFTTDDFHYWGAMGDGRDPHAELPGVAGFRLNAPINRPDRFDEVIAFLGASYFRALGRGSVYGLSARGVAVDTATPRPEEFPTFTKFWLDHTSQPGAVTIHAALDGPSLTGAYRMVMRPGSTTAMRITARLFPRTDIGELGIAPMTSMFLFSEKNRAEFDDYRPAVHDSDGLRIRRADGDVLWRPLNNPPRLTGSYLAETSPRGFGLHQRDREFVNYQDDGARYDRRPSLEVQPIGDWGQGAVRLIEIPTQLEANDNIVAYWVPEQPAKAGEMQEFTYRLLWGDLPGSSVSTLSRVAETRAGTGGVAGIESPENTRKFVIDFEGGLLADLPGSAVRTRTDGKGGELPPRIDLVSSASGGKIVQATLHRVEPTGEWRAVLDVEAPKDAVVELSAHVAGFGRKLSEVWIYQWINA